MADAHFMMSVGSPEIAKASAYEPNGRSEEKIPADEQRLNTGAGDRGTFLYDGRLENKSD